MRRRRDQADAGHRVAQLADVVADLAAGSWPPSRPPCAIDLQRSPRPYRWSRRTGRTPPLIRERSESPALSAKSTTMSPLPMMSPKACSAISRPHLGAVAPDPRRPPRCSTCRRSGSSPRRASHTSVEIEPSDIAPVAKRLTISAAGSTGERSTSPDRRRNRTGRAASCGAGSGR